MGCRKLTYHQEPAISASWVFFTSGKEKTASTLILCIDYYAGGMVMPGRSGNSNSYRYGFNGMEKDDEIKGSGNSYDFGARIYDPRVMRWLSRDPLEAKYPSLSPYGFTNNNPIIYVDVNGEDWEIKTIQNDDGSKTVHVKLTVATLNSSGQKHDMSKFNEALSKQVKDSYGIKYSKVEKNIEYRDMPGDRPPLPIEMSSLVDVNVVVEVDVREVKSGGQLKQNEHLVEIKNNTDLPDVYGKVNKIGGKEVYINTNYVSEMIKGNDNNTLVHELGHTLGLRHIDIKAETTWEDMSVMFGGTGNPQYRTPEEQKKSENNAMFSGGSIYMDDKTSTEIDGEQIETATESYESGELNLD
jgi:RHS repeat-associated protein